MVLEGRWPEAGYFHFISQRSGLSANFIQLSKQGENGKDPAAPILRAMEQIENFEAEVILFYANKENIELLLQQVYLSVLLTFVLYLSQEMFLIVIISFQINISY